MRNDDDLVFRMDSRFGRVCFGRGVGGPERMNCTLDEIDQSFVDDLVKSREAVERAAKWLSELGYPVVIRPTFIRPDPTSRFDYSDAGDLEIIQRIEVKRREGLTFSSRGDFPFNSIIVDTCHAYDKAKLKPYAYIIFNREMSACFVVNKKTRAKWFKTTKRSRGRDRDFYECPIELAEFVEVAS